MGTVYRAVDTMVERDVALKGLKPDIAAQPGLVERFRSEAVLLARLNHPAVAQLYAFFKDGGEYFMAMEYVAGDTLQALIRNSGAIPYPRALAYTAQILQGVGHAHSLGILHRYLKPANVMLTPAEKVKIMDFGIARALGTAGMTRDGRVIGTLEYLAPERIRGKQDDPRSDLYSVGVTLFEMLTGRLPFAGDSDFDLLTAQVRVQPPRPSEIGVRLPPEVESLLMTALEKDPDQRYADAAAFEAAVMALLPAAHPQQTGSHTVAGETRLVDPGSAETRLVTQPDIPGGSAAPTVLATAPPPDLATRLTAAPVGLWAKVRGSRWALLLAAALCGVVLAGGAWLAFRHHGGSPPAVKVDGGGAEVSSPAAPPVSSKPVEPNVSDSDLNPGAAGASNQAGDGSSPVSPSPKPGPGPDRRPTPDAGKPKPPAPSPGDSGGGTVSADVRRAALLALDETDGPSSGDPDTRPIQMAGLLSALKTGGAGMNADFEESVARRGVNFQLTPARRDALGMAGASDGLLKLVDASFRGNPVAAAVKPADVPAPLPAPSPGTGRPAQRVGRLADVRSLFVDCSDKDVRSAVVDDVKAQLGGLMQVVDVASRADAVMKVVATAPTGSRLLRVVKDGGQAVVSVVDAASSRSVWSENVDDRKALGEVRPGDWRKSLASHIVKDMKSALGK